jgi:trimeric autotransporter adhesin
MMLINRRGFIALAGLSATSLYAAQPPTQSSVLSDAFYDTAMGPGSLANDVTPAQGCVPYALNPTNHFMSGCANTATGFAALNHNTTGYENTADGAGALFRNTTGQYNTAVGTLSLFSTSVSYSNTAIGADALFAASTGSFNSALGSYALLANTTGAYNTASGFLALNQSETGSGNTALGTYAGDGLTTGSFNTYIGYGASPISATDNYVTVIGAPVSTNVAGTPTTYVTGIWGTTLTGSTAQVVVNANGQLGVITSSERFKTDIAPLGGNSERLLQLRPVSFHLQVDPHGAVQYGLIAEEVDKVYPELVIRDNEGKIQGVRYDELAPMLLNEVQKEEATVAAQAVEIRDLKQQVAQVNELEQRLDAAFSQLNAKDQVIAQR